MWRRRIALGALSIGVFLLTTEIALQLLSLAARAELIFDRGGEASADVITILCVGDSHTYGTPEPLEFAYPAQLERRLNTQLGEGSVQVLNRGIPGVNSTFVANRLEPQILLLDPDLVIFWVGHNNSWNAIDTDRAGDDWADALHRRLLAVKLYRLARVLVMSSSGFEDEEAKRTRFTGYTVGGRKIAQRGANLSAEEHATGLARDLERMVEITRRLDVPALFVAYPIGAQHIATETIIGSGVKLGVPFVDSRESLARARADGYGFADLMVKASGPHPTRTLYGYVAEDLQPLVLHALALDTAAPIEAR